MTKPNGDYCTRFFRWIPCVFIAAIVLWSYYAYVVELCIMTIESTTKQILCIIFFQILFIMFTWSYWQTTFTDPMNPRTELIQAETEDQKQETIKDFASNFPGMDLRTMKGGYRYCSITGRLKPDRCHYCSVVKQCVLKMDHYCPWVNNCVGYSNYKFFVLFLFYGLLFCLYISLTTLYYFLLFWQNGLKGSGSKFHILFLFFTSVMFAISITTLFFYHMYLVFTNKTTIESWRAPVFRTGPNSNGFNLGIKRNFQQVFGENILLWFIPIFTSLGDGHTFPVRLVHDVESGYANGHHQIKGGLEPSFDSFTSERGYPT